ncbi:GNAT family N-acetyltransferase [Streptomyces sp. 769]|uniref:GNAT family N-acetyltransferase n=1 Tax=Streptomyces sp. 769 TaxID=1262452 RepID=UPI00057ED30A|nr:GNAT family N-acetyltransferase [Streptomyces sp. 769]
MDYRELAKSLEREFPGLVLDVHRSIFGQVVISGIRVPKGERRKGIGTAVMRRLTDAADVNGDRMAATPTTDWGSSKAGLERFYKRFDFRSNKGRKRDLTISESIVREPQNQGSK